MIETESIAEEIRNDSILPFYIKTATFYELKSDEKLDEEIISEDFQTKCHLMKQCHKPILLV